LRRGNLCFTELKGGLKYRKEVETNYDSTARGLQLNLGFQWEGHRRFVKRGAGERGGGKGELKASIDALMAESGQRDEVTRIKGETSKK